uniref:GPN-loop GTPase n=1 Tax=Culicoides sonorensis TaxID=179676 RepID=A0A336MEA2_CULSO
MTEAEQSFTEPKDAETSNSLSCLIVLGMAGSGKTTFVKKLAQFKRAEHKPYIVNLDPACKEVPYPANIDIRDTINYKEVMKQYGLGPNGGIVTALNLFSTKFGTVVDILKKTKDNKYCIIDTPGQIEVFTWSASGIIITEALAAEFPTTIVYVMDIVRSVSPTTFMSNMIYACSILYKTRLPFIVVLNKIDVQSHDFAVEWIKDFEAFHEAIEQEKDYVSNLSRTMSLTLDEFYKDLKVCGISSKTGVGFSKFFELVQETIEEYKNDYKVEYDKIRSEKEAQKANEAVEALRKLKNKPEGDEIDLSPFITHKSSGVDVSDVFLRQPGDESSEESEEEQVVAFTDEEKQEQDFLNFVNQHQSTNK